MTAPMHVDVLWSDDEFGSSDSNEGAICAAVAGRLFTSPRGCPFMPSIHTVADARQVAAEVRMRWSTPQYRGIRVWVADLEFRGDRMAGLEHIKVAKEDVVLDALVVFSSHTEVMRDRIEALLGTRNRRLRKYLFSVAVDRDRLVAVLGEVVDRMQQEVGD